MVLCSRVLTWCLYAPQYPQQILERGWEGYMLCLGHINASVVGRKRGRKCVGVFEQKEEGLEEWGRYGEEEIFCLHLRCWPSKGGTEASLWFQYRSQGWSPGTSSVPGWMQGIYHPALRSNGSRVNHLPVRKQPVVTSHHSGTRGRIKARRSPCFRPQLCSKTLAVRRLRSLSSRKLHFISSPWLFTHHRAGLEAFLPSWLRLYTKHHFLLPRKRTIHSHSYIPLGA